MAGKSHIYNCCSHERSVHCHVWFSEGRLGSLAGKERWPLWTSSHPLGCLGEDGVRQPTWDTKGDPPKKYKLIGTSLWGIYIYICIFYVYIYINQQYEKLVIMYEHYIYTYNSMFDVQVHILLVVLNGHISGECLTNRNPCISGESSPRLPRQRRCRLCGWYENG